jgi:hypothetical protein
MAETQQAHTKQEAILPSSLQATREYAQNKKLSSHEDNFLFMNMVYLLHHGIAA